MEKVYFQVTYRDSEKQKVCTLRCRKVEDSSLGLSFITLKDFVFNTQGAIVNPVEDELKTKFENTKSLHLSLYSIVSIEEIGEGHPGLKFDKDRSGILVFPQNEEH